MLAPSFLFKSWRPLNGNHLSGKRLSGKHGKSESDPLRRFAAAKTAPLIKHVAYVRVRPHKTSATPHGIGQTLELT